MTAVELRRTDILHASAELFADKGVASTTVRQIAARVGVQSGALYHYFPSKSAIVREVVTTYLEQLKARYDEAAPRELDPRARLRAIVEVSLRTAEESPHATVVYQNELPNLRDDPDYRDAKKLADEAQQIWLETINDGKRTGVFREDVPTKVFHRFIRDAVWLSIKWRHPEDAYTTEDLTRDCLTIFLDGFAT
ncbi:TetR/AcrR family transcriptional regulator [Saccharopolyspora oryzae]|uniref:TetR/AcrR family transcriptional regulator n=1 Tax=Saccharopolyspora oryzae TaxID=2997343 RepID=A0ABT4US62_9PSEU|nr:TetR/AcrR family transcriptional regulator [Saccharopolyspora oryzae]MDA3624554.1 TetR/AcrR family transcriptional regulator [Saccharopolyspora oryzae]